jgi:hypothetical protein
MLLKSTAGDNVAAIRQLLGRRGPGDSASDANRRYKEPLRRNYRKSEALFHLASIEAAGTPTGIVSALARDFTEVGNNLKAAWRRIVAVPFLDFPERLRIRVGLAGPS